MTFDLSPENLDKIKEELDDCDSDLDLQTLATDLIEALEDARCELVQLRP